MTKSLKRRNVADITGERLEALNSGTVEAATLTECLAVDFAALMQAALPEIGSEAISILQRESKSGILKRMSMTGELILDNMGEAALSGILNHRSDTVRGWACFLIGAIRNKDIAERLNAIRPLADDHHFGVREWAWMSTRPHIAADLEASICQLSKWATSSSERLRRFACEATRPRGVWCAHLAALKGKPELALPVLEPLRADPTRYVQDSVGNWLNDAGKHQPDWVRRICQRWLEDLPDNLNTQRIVRRALRSLK